MNKIFCFMLALCIAALAAGQNRLPIADPYVLIDGGTYYAYGTHSSDGIEVYTSNDLREWCPHGLALHKDDSYADRCFWAPEVYLIGGCYYMFYSADEHICVATADSPLGPFRQNEKKPIWQEKSIDASLFVDDDGTPYLYFVRFTDGNVIWVAQMNEQLDSILTSTLRQCVMADSPWELAQDIPAKVAEGPSVFKRHGTYYMLYSANHFESSSYGVGCATADSPLGPWRKYEGNPVLQRADGMHGTGHGAPFVTNSGEWKYIFHAHWSDRQVAPRTSYFKPLVFLPDGAVAIQGETISPKVKNRTTKKQNQKNSKK